MARASLEREPPDTGAALQYNAVVLHAALLPLALLVFTAVMLGVHLSSRWLVRRLLTRPRRFLSAHWLLRLELSYYLALAAFWAAHRSAFPFWPVALLGIIHLLAWAAAERYVPVGTGMAWTPKMARVVDEIWVFDLAEALVLVYLAYRLALLGRLGELLTCLFA